MLVLVVGLGESYREDRAALSGLEVIYLTAVSLGWLECGSTLGGQASSRATEAGLLELVEPSPLPALGRPARDNGAVDLYRAERDAALEALRTGKPSAPMQVGFLPLPVDRMAPIAKEVTP